MIVEETNRVTALLDRMEGFAGGSPDTAFACEYPRNSGPLPADFSCHTGII